MVHTRSAASRAAADGIPRVLPSASEMSWPWTSRSISGSRGEVVGASRRDPTVERRFPTISVTGSDASRTAELKDGAPAAGFDAVNSPGLLRTRDFAGRTLVQKTTAGTVGAPAVADAPLVLCASFVVAGPTARFLRDRDAGPVTFVVTGEDGRADEDLACAEYIGRRTAGDDVAPDPYLHRARNSRAAADLAAGPRGGRHPDDVELCLDVDRFSFAMVAGREGHLTVIRPVEAPPSRDTR
ncbi:2-phosphosulfolactate phosphatase [Streptomyces scabiei]|uniref:2-phosphosulfolactate phosphatase n=1 Tax=Streptomyces scabiei TaxID=1930 RepID=UPI00298FD046|nr:2-phosphosulfolactate phosphatase [Streptomyces scabiei]MDW8803502.1 2-phosphosulfolactate phosphatase [Streptomyces scabiei]